MKNSSPFVLLCARDALVAESVEVTAAALGVELVVTADRDAAFDAWSGAALRLVSTEIATRWAAPPGGPAYLVGASAADLARCSAELGLPVLPLPDHTGKLAEAFAQVRESGRARGSTLGVFGGSGGLGVSTLATAIALYAARRGSASACVDLAGDGGGLDLLLGLEAAKGLRWPDLLHARGEADEILPSLPALEGAAFLSAVRDGQARPGEAAIAAVLASLARSAALVVVDAGRRPPSGCDRTLLVVGADVRSVAAARAAAGRHVPDGIVVRRGPGRSLPPETTAGALGAPCWGVINDDPRVPRLAELGMPPLAGPARRYRRQVGALVEVLSHG